MAVDRNLGEALLRQDRAGPQPALEQILQCERRRVRRWAIATGALWVITVGYLFSLIYFTRPFFIPYSTSTSPRLTPTPRP